MRKLFSGLFLALMLLLTQQGAMLHALGHVVSSEAHSDSHVDDDHGHDSDGTAALCASCLAYAQAAVGAGVELMPTPLLCLSRPATSSGSRRSRRRPDSENPRSIA